MEDWKDLFTKNPVSLSDGETYFFYDLQTIDSNVEKLRSLFRSLDQIYFSVKSNPSAILLKKLGSLNVNFDVSSEKELHAAFMASSDYSKITVSGPAKTDSFINACKKNLVKSVHIDSVEEYHLLEKTKVNLSLRWPLESTYSQKVGLPPEDLEKIVKSANKGKKISGVHIYVGRERASSELVKKKLGEIKEFIQSNSSAFEEKPNLYWGAGLPLINHLERDFFPDDPFFSTHLECGRALVHNAAVYVTQILEVKEKANERFVIINGGLQHLASHFGSPRFGQEDVHVFFHGEKNSKVVKTNIYGSLGTTTDVLVKEAHIPSDIKRGDWIAIGPAGGYGYSAGTNQFLGPQRPIEIFFEGHQVQTSNSNSLNYLEAGVYETQISK